MTLTELKAKYPKMLENTLMLVEDGWIELIEVMLTDLTCAAPPDVAISQIAEQAGGLSVLVEEASAAQIAAIRIAEQKAENTCENCGKPGRLQNPKLIGWWYKCVCDACVPIYADFPRRIAGGQVLRATHKIWKTDAEIVGFTHRPHPLLEMRRPFDVARKSPQGSKRVLDILGRLEHGTAA